MISIGSGAFWDCSALTSVTIPNSVKSIGGGAFYGTAWYNNQPDGLMYAGKVAYYYKGEMPANTSISLQEGTLGIAGSAFSYCSGLTSITIPNSVTSIGDYAFKDCSGLTSVTIPNSVTSIGSEAFSGCSALTSVTIPNSVTSIGSNPFRSCSGLTSITVENDNQYYDSRNNCNAIIRKSTNTLIAGCKNTIIPNDVTTIADYAFMDCYGLTSITIPNSVTSIDYRAFNNCSGLTSLTIGNSVTSIGSEAFSGCSALTSVTIGNSVTSIGRYAFYNCSGLTSITIPNSVESIGNGAFINTGWYNKQGDGILYLDNWLVGYKGEKPIGELVINDGTKGIADAAFEYCSGLTSVIIPNSVTSIISRNAFRECSGLTSVTIGNGVTSIGEYAFSSCKGLTSLTIPNNVTSIGSEAFSGCSALTSVHISDIKAWCGISFSDIVSNPLYYAKHLYLNGEEVKELVIPGSVESLGNYAFSGCSGLTSVTIGNSVTSIGRYAFYNCSGLTSVTIPNNVTSIGSEAFSGCSALTSVTIGNSVTSIGRYAFYNCSCLTSVTIPNSLTSIGEYAFSWCSGLTSAIIGNGVTSIGSAFYYCNSLQEMILSQAAYDNGIPESVTKFTTYSKNPMRVEVVSKGVVSATMKIYPIDEQGNTNENNYYTVTTSGQIPGQYIKWKLDDENYGIISEVTEGTLILETQPAQPMSTTKARLIATVNEADDDQHYGFEWLRYNAPDEMPPYQVSAPLFEGHIIGSLGGLNPDIYYKYRAFYKSDAGEMFYGEWVPFLTGDANVFFEPEVHTKEAIVTNDGALLSAVFIEGTEDIQEKGFEYWPMNSNARAVSLTRGDNIGSVIVSGNNTSVTIEGLEAGTEYGYRPYVKTASGTTYGEEKTFKTSMFGDVNGDNKVDHDDLNDLVSYIMGNNPEHFDKDAADLNNDKKVNAADIVKMVKILK